MISILLNFKYFRDKKKVKQCARNMFVGEKIVNLPVPVIENMHKCTISFVH